MKLSAASSLFYGLQMSQESQLFACKIELFNYTTNLLEDFLPINLILTIYLKYKLCLEISSLLLPMNAFILKKKKDAIILFCVQFALFLTVNVTPFSCTVLKLLKLI